MIQMDLQPFLDFATQTAYQAGRLTLAHFNTGVTADYKADDSPVTAADRAAEAHIRARIGQAYPGHAILGEEYGEQAGGADFRWVIDPIDGTKSFLRSVPLFAVLLGLEIEGWVRVGAAYFPALDEMLCAADGLGCWWNGRRAHVSPAADLSRAYVTFTNHDSFGEHGRAAAWERLRHAAYAVRGWSDCYGYLLVATGRAEVALDPVMNAWDCGPFPPILREAGGYFGDWSGREGVIDAGESLAVSQTLLPQVLDLLRGRE